MNPDLKPEPPLKYKLGHPDELENYLNQEHICTYCFTKYTRRYMKDHFKQKTHNKIFNNRLEFHYFHNKNFDSSKFFDKLQKVDDIDFVEIEKT